jgi:hypothetical protein
MQRVSEAVGSLLFRVGCGIAVIGPLILASQCMAWLKLGSWTPISVDVVIIDFFGLPEPAIKTSMLGLQKIIDALLPAVLDLPASMVLVILGAAIVAFADKHFAPQPRRPSPDRRGPGN